MTLPKKVALAVTSYNGPLYPDGAKTGAFYTEVYHPFEAYIKAGLDVDLVSETGAFGWDEHSLDPSFVTQEELEASKDPKNPFYKAIHSVKKASEANPTDYGMFNAAGGHGTVYDFVGHAPGLSKLASDIWQNGGIVTAVCHGPCLLPDIKDKNNVSIAKGRKVTGFPNEGEVAMKLTELLDEKHLAYTANVIESTGADYQIASPPFDAKVVIDGRLISGANPASAAPAAEASIKAFESL